MDTKTIHNVIGELCCLITSGAGKLIDYLHNVIKSTCDYISKTYLESLSTLRSLWTSVKASLSSAMDYIKEKTTSAIRVIMEGVLLLFKRFVCLFVELIADLALSKTVSETVVKTLITLLRKLTGETEDTLLPALNNILRKREVVVSPQVVSCVTDLTTREVVVVSSPFASGVTDLTKLCEEQRNTPEGNNVVEIAQAIGRFLGSCLGLLDGCFGEVCDTIDADAKNK